MLDRLENALAARVDANTYFTFANALSRKGELTSEPGLRAQLIRRAAAYYEEALRLDWDCPLESKINKALSAMQPVPVARPPAAAQAAAGK